MIVELSIERCSMKLKWIFDAFWPAKFCILGVQPNTKSDAKVPCFQCIQPKHILYLV